MVIGVIWSLFSSNLNLNRNQGFYSRLVSSEKFAYLMLRHCLAKHRSNVPANMMDRSRTLKLLHARHFIQKNYKYVYKCGDISCLKNWRLITFVQCLCACGYLQNAEMNLAGCLHCMLKFILDDYLWFKFPPTTIFHRRLVRWVFLQTAIFVDEKQKVRQN